MKAISTYLFVSLLSLSLLAQEADHKKQSNEENTPAEEQENLQKKTEKPKSFTLNPDDALVEQVEVSDPFEVDEIHQTSSKTTYHYDHYRRHDEIQTLAGNHGHNGGFGAISFRATEFNQKDMIMMGFRGGWIINRAMAIGFEGYGAIPTAEYENIDPNSPYLSRAVGGYGGLFLEPILFSNKVVHVTFPVAGGGGWLGYMVDWEQNSNYTNNLIDDDVFWYVEPGAALELNVARNFRINMGASYRITEDLKLVSTSSSGFDGWNYFLTLKFGSF